MALSSHHFLESWAERDVDLMDDIKLPDNLYVCDATLLPQALGLPPMLTIMALAKRIARIISNPPPLSFRA